MQVVAGILGLAYAALHGIPAIANVNQDAAARGSGQPGAIPRWARYLWLALAAVAAVGAVITFSGSALGVGLLTVGVVGIALLAIANGHWMKGSPTVFHHVVRFALAALVLVPAFLGVD